MANFFDNFKKLVNPGEEEDYPEDGANDYGFDNSSNYGGEEEFYGQPAQPQQSAQPQAAPSRAPQGSGMAINGNSLELKVIRPEHWEQVNQIADHLINRRTVVLNMEGTNKETARRMIDFLLGVVYTIEGDIKKVAANTWVITPSNVDMSLDQQQNRQNVQNNNFGM